ncbi:riboflavin biosynthesis protein RibF [Flaviaesturariibacter flavus]|uniref:riboflavin biosynthesis protein RibF n=1 Tax=Flaviaesturariibacter flavus TaxID=2502780 RepID=UPI001FB52037|nr:riboflavin biosynthesis protein RibF [Flaviaesturariibacter flavus]
MPRFRNAVVTIGTFDGVHTGHQQILAALRQEAASTGGETVVITFDPHPRTIVQTDASLELLTTLPEKAGLLEAHGIDHLVVVPFTPDFAAQDAEQYISDFLVRRFQPHTLIIGYDHRFGKGRAGGYELLEQLQHQYGYRLIEIPRQVLHSIAISSTKIRTALKQSDVATANELLGYPFFFEGLVIPGDKLGRTIGYPTANLQYTSSDKIRLGEGVFAARAIHEGRTLGGMLSIGKRPTLNDVVERVEINLFDFQEEIYDQVIRVEVLSYLRGQEKYSSLDALKEQLHRDKEDSLRILSSWKEHKMGV